MKIRPWNLVVTTSCTWGTSSSPNLAPSVRERVCVLTSYCYWFPRFMRHKTLTFHLSDLALSWTPGSNISDITQSIVFLNTEFSTQGFLFFLYKGWNVMLPSLHFRPSIYTVRDSYWLTFSHRSGIVSVRSEHRFNIWNNEWMSCDPAQLHDRFTRKKIHTESADWHLFSSFISTVITHQKKRNFCITFKHHHLIRY